MNVMSDQNAARKEWLGLLAKAPPALLAQLWAGFDHPTPKTIARAPEIGGVMVRGRAGATGAAFNLGEMTVTRASITLDCGAVGHGYVQGRSKDHAMTAAIVDALMQTNAKVDVERAILSPLRAAATAKAEQRAAKAAATKVDFFPIARGED